MSPEAKALAEVEEALHRAVRHLFDAQVEISKAQVARSKADALKKDASPPARQSPPTSLRAQAPR